LNPIFWERVRIKIDASANVVPSDAAMNVQVFVIKDEFMMFASERTTMGSGTGAYGW